MIFYCFLDLPWKTLVLSWQAIFTVLGHFEGVVQVTEEVALFCTLQKVIRELSFHFWKKAKKPDRQEL